jgi:hypothetical protein
MQWGQPGSIEVMCSNSDFFIQKMKSEFKFLP